jgi:methionyl-tRNA formyltransferase
MLIALLCATRRGYLFLDKLTRLLPEADLAVFSFREAAWEPPFLDDIRDLATTKGSQFFETRRIGHPQWKQFWESTTVDLMFAVNWRYMIPASIWGRPRLGTFVFHDSLLPEYRGFSPTVWAMINGEDHTGVTLFRIADEVDSGDIVDQERIPIGPDEPIATVTKRVTQTYLALLERNLVALTNGTAPTYAQDHLRATYTCKRLPADNRIDWPASSEEIHNLVRAVSAPYPGAYTSLSEQTIHIWSAQRLTDAPRYVGRVPGRVVEVRPGEGSVVLTGDGALLVKQVQVEGGVVTCAANVLNRLGQTLGR